MEDKKDRRLTILAVVETAAAKLIYYDRKEDEDLGVGGNTI